MELKQLLANVEDQLKPMFVVRNVRKKENRPLFLLLFLLPENTNVTNVTISVYNITGKLIRVLVSGSQAAGAKSVRWDGRDSAGKSIANGLYFIRLETPQFKATKKMLLIK